MEIAAVELLVPRDVLSGFAVEPLVQVAAIVQPFELGQFPLWVGVKMDAVAAHGMTTPDGSFGVVVTGALTQNLFDAVVGCIPEGTWEFVSHPGHNDAELDRVRTRLRDSREKELAILTAEAVKEALRREQVQLISYREL